MNQVTLMLRGVLSLALLSLSFISLAIWLYLLYQILVRVGASELMFFLYWVYVPASIGTALIVQAIKKVTDE